MTALGTIRPQPLWSINILYIVGVSQYGLGSGCKSVFFFETLRSTEMLYGCDLISHAGNRKEIIDRAKMEERNATPGVILA